MEARTVFAADEEGEVLGRWLFRREREQRLRERPEAQDLQRALVALHCKPCETFNIATDTHKSESSAQQVEHWKTRKSYCTAARGSLAPPEVAESLEERQN